MKTVMELVCPKCLAELSYEKGREQMFCQYCGTKLLINDENTYTYRHVDEAEVRRVENEKDIKMKELELEEVTMNAQQARFDKYTKVWLTSVIVLLVLGLFGSMVRNYSLARCWTLGLIVGIWGFVLLKKMGKEEKSRGIGVEITDGLIEYKNKNYNTVKLLFKQAGFSNIKVVPLNDLGLFGKKKDGMVESVLINNSEKIKKGDVYPLDSKIIIMYHSSK